MTVTAIPLSSANAVDLCDLAWELACSAEIVVKIDEVNTDFGVERCVSARCVAGEHAFLLVPRGEGYVEVYWGEYDVQPHLVGMAADVASILALAEYTCLDRAA